jgi:surface protein
MNDKLITKQELRDKILNNEDISGVDYSHIRSMAYMFLDCDSLKTIPKLDTSNVTDMFNMFKGCSSLTTIPEMNTSKVTSMTGMFMRCSSLESIPDLDTSKVTDTFNMFKGTIFEKIPEIVMDKLKGTKNFRKNLEAMIKLYKD